MKFVCVMQFVWFMKFEWITCIEVAAHVRARVLYSSNGTGMNIILPVSMDTH